MMNNNFIETILIIDDTPTNLEVIYDALDNEGYEVLVEIDSRNAIETVKYNSPDLILLDVMMPVIDGFEICRQLQAESLTKDIPIIFMTALADPVDKIKGLSLGAVDYITKPFDKGEALARISIHLKLRKLTKSLEKSNGQLQELTNNLEEQVTQQTVELSQTQLQLIRSEKMSALGQLVAGVAHEINNPVSFLFGNIAPAQEYIDDITRILRLYQKYYPNPNSEIERELKQADLEFTLEDLGKILDSMKVGVERIQDISVSLRNFSRSDTTKVLTDLHQGLDSSLLILRHRLKSSGERPEIHLIKEYAELPEVECYPGQINQVFINLLANAIDATEEAWEKHKINQLIIRIVTEIQSENIVVVRIIDNGLGIPDTVKPYLFESMFTTKAMGKGTGLGLSISHQIIVENHHGKLICNSKLNQGCEFAITIPIK